MVRGCPVTFASSAPAQISAHLATVLFDISQLLNTGVDRATLNVLVGLTESGVNPEALAVRAHRALAFSDPSSPSASFDSCGYRLL